MNRLLAPSRRSTPASPRPKIGPRCYIERCPEPSCQIASVIPIFIGHPADHAHVMLLDRSTVLMDLCKYLRIEKKHLACYELFLACPFKISVHWMLQVLRASSNSGHQHWSSENAELIWISDYRFRLFEKPKSLSWPGKMLFNMPVNFITRIVHISVLID